jgi:hypothetical protein
MKIIIYIYLILFGLAGIISGDVITRTKAYVIQQGGNPDIVNKRGSSITIFTTPEGDVSRVIWNVHKLGYPWPGVEALPNMDDALSIISEYENRKHILPQQQQIAENKFFSLTELILTTLSHPRAGETPPVKLTFTHINELITQIKNTDPLTAVFLSLELLAIDAELKRFNTLWWDTAKTHIIE